ncbi:MAG TPA: hypothetical protein VGJ70_09935 [Solirubrobacteraceae bacterium]
MSESPQPSSVRDVPYKGAPLDAERGPGLGCFRFQLAVLAILIVAAPVSAWLGAPDWLSAALLIGVVLLLLTTGQTIIFLLRLVAADRRAAGRRRPMAGRSPTVGQIEEGAPGAPHDQPSADEPPPETPVRQ